MAESFPETGKAVARGALEDSLTYIKVPQGGKFLIRISTDNIHEVCMVIKNVHSKKARDEVKLVKLKLD